jgi:hypothetical protein
MDAKGVVAGAVRTDNSHEDEKEHKERQVAEPFADYRKLDPKLLRRPGRGTHDFDLDVSGLVALSLEVKGLTWPSLSMRALHQSGEAAFSLSDFEDEIRKDLLKANAQLDGAPGRDKVILIVWSYEDDPSSSWGRWLRATIASIGEQLSGEIEIWITTSRAFHFTRVR